MINNDLFHYDVLGLWCTMRAQYQKHQADKMKKFLNIELADLELTNPTIETLVLLRLLFIEKIE